MSEYWYISSELRQCCANPQFIETATGRWRRLWLILCAGSPNFSCGRIPRSASGWSVHAGQVEGIGGLRHARS